MEVVALLRHLQASPQKMQRVADLIRGRDVEDAVAILQRTQRRAAGPLEKLVKSAVANAEKSNADVGTLYVKEIVVKGGPTLKRVRLNTMGRAFRKLKRQSHVTVKLDTRRSPDGTGTFQVRGGEQDTGRLPEDLETAYAELDELYAEANEKGDTCPSVQAGIQTALERLRAIQIREAARIRKSLEDSLSMPIRQGSGLREQVRRLRQEYGDTPSPKPAT